MCLRLRRFSLSSSSERRSTFATRAKIERVAATAGTRDLLARVPHKGFQLTTRIYGGVGRGYGVGLGRGITLGVAVGGGVVGGGVIEGVAVGEGVTDGVMVAVAVGVGDGGTEGVTVGVGVGEGTGPAAQKSSVEATATPVLS